MSHSFNSEAEIKSVYVVLLLASPIVLVVVLVPGCFSVVGAKLRAACYLSISFFYARVSLRLPTGPDDEDADDDEGRGRFENLKWTERNSPN